MGIVVPWAAARFAGRASRSGGGVRDTIQPASSCFHMQHDTCHIEPVFCIQAHSYPSGRAIITSTTIPGPQPNCQGTAYPFTRANLHILQRTGLTCVISL